MVRQGEAPVYIILNCIDWGQQEKNLAYFRGGTTLNFQRFWKDDGKRVGARWGKRKKHVINEYEKEANAQKKKKLNTITTIEERTMPSLQEY